MLEKFREAFELFSSNFVLFSMLVLTVWLPGNLLIEYLECYLLDEESLGGIKAAMWIESLFGPIYAGALLKALSQIKQNQPLCYTEAIKTGIKNWGRLFITRFVAGIIIILGLVALVIPGIILMVRYALLDSTVILEGADADVARKRSSALTKNRRWQIFGASVFFFVLFFFCSMVVYVPLAFFPLLDNLLVNVILDCALDIGYALFIIVLFLYYWEAAQNERTAAVTVPPHIE